MKALSVIPSLLLALVCLAAAAKNTNTPLLVGALLTAAPYSHASDEAELFSRSESYTEPSVTVTHIGDSESPAEPISGEHPVRELTVIKGASENSGSKVHFSNRTDYNIDINDYVSAELPFKTVRTTEPQVLILHTHATEAYLDREATGVDGSSAKRSVSPDENMLAVGERLIRVLEAEGIYCLHDTTLHDHPTYSGSYDRAAESIAGYLEKYPSIRIVLDLHRDAMWQDDGTRLKPTVLINGRKAAQIMIISGTDKGGLTFDSWRNNLSFAAPLQLAGDRMYNGLMRPLNIAAARYNMHFTSGSLLLEFGSDVNTLDEALYSAELFGSVLLSVISE